MEAADAMPEDKYGFKPTNGEFEGVLTFGEQVKHVAFYNYATFAIMFGEKPPAEADAARGPEAVRTKADILKYARDSFAGWSPRDCRDQHAERDGADGKPP